MNNMNQPLISCQSYKLQNKSIYYLISFSSNKYKIIAIQMHNNTILQDNAWIQLLNIDMAIQFKHQMC